MANPKIAGLAHDRRLVDLASNVLRSLAVPFRATLFAKGGRANWLVSWHQDISLPLAVRVNCPEWGSWSIKAGMLCANAPAWAMARVVALRICLDESTADNGPLRVIPGSHDAGVLSPEAICDWVRRSEPVSCLVPRGGIVVMRPLLIHGSSRALVDLPRRVIHVEHAERFHLPSGHTIAPGVTQLNVQGAVRPTRRFTGLSRKISRTRQDDLIQEVGLQTALSQRAPRAAEIAANVGGFWQDGVALESIKVGRFDIRRGL
ncbi:MAG TPA: phytanoyl-CoA dioxygenase family protein [Blastocatellia bacterium]